MMDSMLIFLGAGFGGVSRYWVSNATYTLLGRQFPHGTLVVNASGCFLIGFLFTLITDRFSALGPALRSLLLIGFLGGYTTFSSFSLETLNLFENGAWFNGCLNIILSIGLCLMLTWLGIFGARQL